MKPIRAVPLVIFGFALALAAQENTEKKRPENNRKAVPSERPAQSAQPQAAPQQRQEPRRETPAPVQRTAPSERRDQMPRSRPDNPSLERQVPREQPQQQQRPQTLPRRESPQVYQPRPNPPVTREQTQPQRPNVERPRGTNPPDARVRQAQPTRTFTTRTGDVIHRDSSGQVRQVRTNGGTVVYRPPNAPRRVEVQRPGGRYVVTGAPGRGYVQRPVVIRNTTIIKRTYIYNGAPHARLYRPRMYNGVSLAIYMPVRYYRPAFYSWVYNPWPGPVRYSWGWSGRPWYGYYGGYFSPYPVYASPALWLTDFMLGAILESAYEERMADRAYASSQYYDPAPPDPLSPEVKQAIAEEVRRQIDRERAEGQSDGAYDTAPYADNVPHVFVVNAGLVVNSNAGECSLGEGDVLQMTSAPRPNATYGDLVVLASRGRACPKGSRVEVGLQDLQEMQNQMRATLDRGMGDLQSRQGQDGLPRLPEGGAGTVDSPFAREAQPDTDAARELADAGRDADRAEQQAISQSGDAPPVLTVGMSLDEVRAIQGNPRTIVDLGEKKTYVYQDLKITFLNGKVTDIQ